MAERPLLPARAVAELLGVRSGLQEEHPEWPAQSNALSSWRLNAER